MYMKITRDLFVFSVMCAMSENPHLLNPHNPFDTRFFV